MIGVSKEQDAPPLDFEARALLDYARRADRCGTWIAPRSLARWSAPRLPPKPSACATRCWRLSPTTSARRCPQYLGAATSLIDYGDKLDETAKKDLLGQIKKEAEDLDEMVPQPSGDHRIDAGALELRRDWIDLREVAERVVSAARRHGALQRIEICRPIFRWYELMPRLPNRPLKCCCQRNCAHARRNACSAGCQRCAA